MYKPIITNVDLKPLILNKVSEEYIFTYYGLTVQVGLMLNPFRNDRKPTCSFYRTEYGELRFKDFSGFCNWNCFGFVMFIKNCNYRQALELIYLDLVKSDTQLSIAEFAEIQKAEAKIEIGIKDFSEKEIQWWKAYGISKDTLERFRTYSCDWVRLNEDVYYTHSDSNPAYAYYFKNNKFKIYIPKNKKFISNTDVIQGYDQLPEEGEKVVIQKSMKDVMLLHELGVPSVAPQGEGHSLDSSLVDNLKSRFKNVYIWYDNDEAGISNSTKLASQHDLQRVDFKEAKDPSDFVKEKSKLELIQIPYLNEIFNHS